MEELKDFVDKKVHFIATHAVITEIYNALQLLEGQERKRLIDLHTQLVQVMFTELKKRNTSDLSFVEEAIISSSSSSSDIKKQVLAILSPSPPSTAAPEKVFLPTDKLRLVPSPFPPLLHSPSFLPAVPPSPPPEAPLHITSVHPAPVQAMIYLIAAQPPPSAQDFADIEHALMGGGGEEEVHAKSESVKAALQWVRRFEIPAQDAVPPAPPLPRLSSTPSLRRDAKVLAAPSSSLAKAGSMLTKAVGSFVGGSSGSAVTQVRRLLVVS